MLRLLTTPVLVYGANIGPGLNRLMYVQQQYVEQPF